VAAQSEPLLSVVIPTRDRPEALSRCLAAIARQRGCGKLEVLVVDDGSSHPEEVGTVAGARPGVRVLTQPRSGPAAARNLGARSAVAPVICFTDDDCEPAPDWAARLSRRLGEGASAAAGSTVVPDPRDVLAGATHLVAEHLREWTLGPEANAPFAPSNNLACRAHVMTDVPFDERYGAPGGEDRAWCARLARRGMKLAHEPAAVVVHRSALTLPAFWRQHERYGRGAFLLRRSGAWRLEPPAFYRSLLRRAFAQGMPTGVLVCAAQAATASGFAREALG
jgi:glycosyltransferase involved in cell wall biosynthesis